jgi:hypothetical protein
VIERLLSNVKGEYIVVCCDFNSAFSEEIINSSTDWLKTLDLIFAIERISIVALLNILTSFGSCSIASSMYLGQSYVIYASALWSRCCYLISHKSDFEYTSIIF